MHVANLLQMGNMAGTHFGQPAWGVAGRFERDGHALVSGQEDPRTVHRGHTIHHNLQRPLHAGSEGYFLYHRVFEESRRQGCCRRPGRTSPTWICRASCAAT